MKPASSPPNLLTDGPPRAAAAIILAHGAGAAMDTDFMNAFAQGLAKHDFQVVRFEFPYMAARRETGQSRPPDREPVLRETWLRVIDSVKAETIVIGGKSMGGRIASLVADEAEVAGLVCLGYPFHPTGKPQQLRVEHLKTIETPTLIVQGERDPFGTRQEVASYKLSKQVKVHWLPDGDHSFKPRKSSGRTLEENWAEGADAVAGFVRSCARAASLILVLLIVSAAAALAQSPERDSVSSAKSQTANADHATSPQAALAAMSTPADLRVELVLGEPVVRQPVFFNFDERGRMWVVQYLQYPAPAGLKVLSRDGYWRAVYDKVPPPPPNHFRGEDKITIHEDTDGDGVFDHHKTFLDGLNIVTALARGRGGVWVLNPPYLLFYPDRDNDDVPDGDPEVHLEGFGLEDTHSVVNSLCWGPDGWLYAAQGSTVSGHVRRPGDKNQTHSLGQNIWRYHPERRRYEIFAEGGGNAFGVEIDAQGRIFSGHNGGDTRGFHYVQGGYLQKGFDKHGPLSNPYAFGYFPAMPHNRTPRFTHTFIRYEADAIPERYRGKLFAVAPLLTHVMMAGIEPDGSTFRTKDIEPALASSDPSFRPVDIKLGPDGAIYIADWCDAQIAHTRNQEGQIDKSNGRIYRLVAAEAKPQTPAANRKPIDLGKLSPHALIDKLSDPNRTVRQTALRLLGDRKDKPILPRLRDLAMMSAGQRALEALWALHLGGGLDDENAARFLRHSDPHVRLWTVRLLCDRDTVASFLAKQIAELAARETNVEVRSQLASSARRLPAAECLAIVRALLARSEDADDPRLPLLLWWAIESKCEASRDAVLEMLRDREVWNLPLVERHLLERLMRRFAAAGTRQDLLTCSELLKRAPSDQHRKRLMAGFEAAYAGRSVANLPDDLLREIDRFAADSPMLGLRQGREAAVEQAIKTILDDAADPTLRVQYVQILGEVHQPRAVGALVKLASESRDSALRAAALLSLRRYDDRTIPASVLAVFSKMTDDERSAALRLLVARPASAQALVAAIERGEIDKQAIPSEIVQELSWHQDKELQAALDRLFPARRPATPSAIKEQIDRVSGVVAAQPGTPKIGRELYAQHCAKCHTLFGKGAATGPDLTAFPRQDLANLLSQIVDPNTAIREGYLTSLVTMADGRVLSGIVVDQDTQIVVLRGADGKDLSLARADIEAMETSKLSLMPEGLLGSLTDDQVRDLFAYLRSSQPVIDQ